MKIFLIFSLLTTVALFVDSRSYAEAALHAHEHGFVKVAIAVEQNVAMISIDTPSESLLGFEYKPQTEQEIKAYRTAQAQWQKMFDLVSFDPKLGCRVEESNFEQKFDEPQAAKDKGIHDHAANKAEAIHSDIEATAKVTCHAKIEGTAVKVAFRQHFKHIQKLTVEVVSGKTFSVDVKNLVETIHL